jgi:hypothetical protein
MSRPAHRLKAGPSSLDKDAKLARSDSPGGARGLSEPPNRSRRRSSVQQDSFDQMMAADDAVRMKAEIDKELHEIQSRVNAAVDDWTPTVSPQAVFDAQQEFERARWEMEAMVGSRHTGGAGKRETLESLGTWFGRVQEKQAEDDFLDGDENDGVVERVEEALAVLQAPDTMPTVKKFQGVMGKIRGQLAAYVKSRG